MSLCSHTLSPLLQLMDPNSAARQGNLVMFNFLQQVTITKNGNITEIATLRLLELVLLIGVNILNEVI